MVVLAFSLITADDLGIALSASSTCTCPAQKCVSGETISCSATNSQGGTPSCICSTGRVHCYDYEYPAHVTDLKCLQMKKKLGEIENELY